MRKVLLLLFTGFICFAAAGQNNFWADRGENASFTTTGRIEIKPEKYRASALNLAQLKTFLWSVPKESAINSSRSNAPVMQVPMPDGSMARFRVWESNIMEPALAAKFPDMKQFLGQGIDDPYATIRFDINPFTGFHAQILSSAKGRVFIDPYAKGDLNYYVSYNTNDYKAGDPNFICGVTETRPPTQEITTAACLGATLRTYRLALACTGEYAVAVCLPNAPTVAATAAAMLTSVNRVVGVYEKEVSLRMILVGNNNNLIYLNGATDPYTNNNGGAMLGENQANVDAVIGTANYDIGHVFSTGGGGVANLNSPCNAGVKARGVTGRGVPIGDPFDIDYVAHEMGHQWGGNHSMAGCGSSPISTKFEVGSGTTIQAYAGICGAQDIQPNSDPHFHGISFDEISNYIVSGGGSACPVSTGTGNTLPVITGMSNGGVTIPVSTPFTLTGTATDADGDALTYNWEQWDIGGGSFHGWNEGATAGPGNTVPLFKSRLPKTTGSRTIPDIAVILAGYPASPPATMGGLKGETLSPVARAMKFKLTVRDNRAGGGGSVSSGSGGCQGGSSDFIINVAGSAPFLVTVPNGGESWPAGSSQTVTWNVVGTNGAPFNVANVRITLSTDGGLTYPVEILASTPNDGSQTITVPNNVTTTARVRVEALGNIFFDISNNNFTITAPPNGFNFNTPVAANASCPAPTEMQTSLTAVFNGGFSNPVTLSSAGNPPGTTVVFGTNPLLPGTPTTTVTLTGTNTLSFGTYTIQVTGTASGAPPQTQNVNFIINASTGPAFTQHPASQTVCQGSPVTFTVAATGATSYIWQKSTDGGANWTTISGATTTTYTIASVQPSDGALYRSVASGQCGATNSNNATLTVNTPPAITAHPANITICAGSNHTFTVTATGTGLTYQWQTAPTCAGTFTDISGATSSSLTLAAATTAAYRVVITGSCTPAATSNCALMTVVNPVTVSSNPSNVTVCEGAAASFTGAGTSSQAIIYQWQISTDGGGTYNNIPGANAATYTIPAVTFAMNNNRYRLQMSNATCTTPVNTTGAILTVNTLPTLTSQPANSTICAGSNTSFNVTATGTGITYQWQLSTDGGANYSNIAGATAATYTVTAATVGMNNYRYRVIISGTCTPPAQSNAAVLTVIAPVSITAQAANAEVCSGSNASFSVTGSSTLAIIYQWQDSTSAHSWQNMPGETNATLNLTAVTTAWSGNKYRLLLSNVTCSTPTVSNVALLTVRQLPTIGLTATSNSLLPGNLDTLRATPSASSGGTITTAWFYNNNPITNAGNVRIINIEQVGIYRVGIAETWASGLVCTNQSQPVTITATASPKLFIFPSPNDGRFSVAYYNNGGTSTQRRIVIIDSKGAKVYERQFQVSGAYTLMNIDLRGGARGIYYVLVGDATGKKLASGKVHVR